MARLSTYFADPRGACGRLPPAEKRNVLISQSRLAPWRLSLERSQVPICFDYSAPYPKWPLAVPERDFQGV
jgi:hypothetical protein